ncbi:hypothetical protein [uncultured Flavobacterium sp.]|uniref:hypothetical protein n=1 Tax=uncultured Flavobacterium sp. TaxID=165435 RepID=UPI0030ECE79E|tara:strand:+ start:1845 stop:2414 length:570 start_codon:yes stop_codon:yes gene_type:complete
MKYLVLILFFTISTFSQEIKNDSVQVELFNHANLCLDFKDNKNAYLSFKKAYYLDSSSDLALLVYKKIDSLNRILKATFLKDISGKWEIVYSGSNWGISKEKVGLVTIKNSDISFDFYDKSNSLKSLKLNLMLDDFLNYSFNEFILDDNSLWSFKLKDEKLYISELGEKTEEGRSLMVCGNFFMECIRK